MQPFKNWLCHYFTDKSKKLFTYKGPTELKNYICLLLLFLYIYETNPLPSSTQFYQGTVGKIIILRKQSEDQGNSKLPLNALYSFSFNATLSTPQAAATDLIVLISYLICCTTRMQFFHVKLTSKIGQMNQAFEVSISLHYLERKTRMTGSDIAIRQLCFCGKMLERNNSFQEIKLN